MALKYGMGKLIRWEMPKTKKNDMSVGDVVDVFAGLVALLICAWAASQIPWPQYGLLIVPMLVILHGSLSARRKDEGVY